MRPSLSRLLCAALLPALLVAPAAAPASAQCVEGDCVNGTGKKITRGHIYEGEFVNNHRQGHGVYVFPDGSVYKGQFVNGAMEGEGEYTYQDGESYKGTFKNNKRNGQGTYYRKDGTIVTGLWEDNVLVMEGEGLVTTGLELDEADLESSADNATAETSGDEPLDELERELEEIDDSGADQETENGPDLP